MRQNVAGMPPGITNRPVVSCRAMPCPVASGPAPAVLTWSFCKCLLAHYSTWMRTGYAVACSAHPHDEDAQQPGVHLTTILTRRWLLGCAFWYGDGHRALAVML